MNHSCGATSEDQSLSQGGSPGIYHIGRTEPTNSLDIETGLSLENEHLRRKNAELENKNGQLQHQTLVLKLENNEIRRKNRQLEQDGETERRKYEQEMKNIQHKLDESNNCLFDVKHSYRLQIENKDEQIRSLSSEVTKMRSRLMTYENEDMRDIRHRQSKRFKSSVLKECKRCHSVIADNNDFKCCFHPEKPIRSLTYSPTNQLLLWKCCFQVSKLEPPGCTSCDDHEPAT